MSDGDENGFNLSWWMQFWHLVRWRFDGELNVIRRQMLPIWRSEACLFQWERKNDKTNSTIGVSYYIFVPNRGHLLLFRCKTRSYNLLVTKEPSASTYKSARLTSFVHSQKARLMILRCARQGWCGLPWHWYSWARKKCIRHQTPMEHTRTKTPTCSGHIHPPRDRYRIACTHQTARSGVASSWSWST